jgi:type I restriction enzyme, S subunit
VKYRPYPKYKSSGIEWLGDVPHHWDVKRGRYCMRVNPRSHRLRQLKPEDEVSFIPMEAVGENGGLNLDVTRPLGEIGSSYTEFEDGDIVVAKITPCFENGKGALASGLQNGVALGTTELHVLRPLPHLEGRFLFYLTMSSVYRKMGEAEMYGAGGQKRVPHEFNKDFAIPLPPRNEQRVIARFIEAQTARLETLMTTRRELIEKLKEKRTALISRTVTRGLPPKAARPAGLKPHPKLKPSGIEWLGDIPQHWTTPPLYVRYSIELGKMLNEGRISGDHLVPYLRNIDVQWDRIDLEDLPEMGITPGERERYTVAPGDLLVCEGGEVGRAAIVQTLPQSLGFQKALHRMRPKTASEVQRFMYYTLLWASAAGVFIAEGNPNTIPHLTGEKLRRYRFPTPPPEEQTAIARYLDRETTKIDRMVEKVEAAIERLQEYRTALITAAVTGKIDVRETASQL